MVRWSGCGFGVHLMKFGIAPVAFAILALNIGAVQAFQETTLGGAPSPSSEKKAAVPTAPTPAAPSGLSILTPQQEKAAKGEDKGGFRIPGLGDLGVLPKMNFGLELLYGQGDSRETAVTKPQDAPIDDLMIRGSVKHNF